MVSTITRLFRLGIRFAAWATPHVQAWHRKRNLNVTEAERHLAARNWSEAERHLMAALAEARHSSKKRIQFLLDLGEAQRRQGKLTEAEQTARSAIQLAAGNHALHGRAMAALADVQIDQQDYTEAERTIREIAAIEAAQPQPDPACLANCARNLGQHC